MVEFTLGQWMVLGGVTGAGVLAMLHAMAAQIRNHAARLDHAAECAAIKARYLRSARDSKRALQAQVQIVGEESDDVEVI